MICLCVVFSLSSEQFNNKEDSNPLTINEEFVGDDGVDGVVGCVVVWSRSWSDFKHLNHGE